MISLDINKKLDYILLKNKIIMGTSCEKVIDILYKLEKEIELGFKVGLYGVGIEAEGLLYFIARNTVHFKIDVCFDKVIRSYKYKDMIQNTTVNPIEMIKDTDVDYMILASYAYRDTFAKNLYENNYRGTIIDLYEYMEEYIEDHFADYEDLYQTKQRYQKEKGRKKIGLLKRLIKKYILIKDFENAFFYIDLYITQKFDEYKRYMQLKYDLQIMLQDIHNCIKERGTKDIIINWIDAISYYDVSAFDFLKKKEKEGICFENAYTVMPWTTETTKTILCGEYPIEGKLFLKDVLSEDNAVLLKILGENGYKFAYCGMPRFAKLLDESVIAPVSFYENKNSGSLQKHWDSLSVLCCSETPVCVLIHTLRETHEPFICGECETFIRFDSTRNSWELEECRRQAQISGEYIDNQLAFYEKFYHENAVEIYMSDHGRVGNSPMDENKIHVMLMISGKGIRRESIKPIFSLIKFPELIKKIIFSENDWKTLTSDYGLIENFDAYNEMIVQRTLSGEFSIEEMYQCRGIVTLTDRYYLYCYGKEYYFVDCDSRENEIDNPIYRDRVLKLRELCGKSFIDISLYDKFRYSRLLYSQINL